MNDKPDLLTVWEALGGTTRSLKSYGWTAASCCLHEDRVTSAQINEEKQTFRCMVCDVYGDVYTLVMKKEGIGFRESTRRAAELTGDSSPLQRQSRPRNTRLPLVARDKRSSGGFVPPWLRGGPGAGA